MEPEGQDFKISLQMTVAELTDQETVVVPVEPESQGKLAEQKQTVWNQQGGRARVTGQNQQRRRSLGQAEETEPENWA